MNWMREFFLQLLGGFRVFEAALLTGSAPNMSSIVAAAFSWPDKWQLSLRCRLTMDCWRPKRELHEWALWRAALLLDTSPPTGASISWRSFWSLCFSIWSPVFFSTLLIWRWDICRVKRGFTKDRLTWIEEANCQECSESYWPTWKCLRSWSSVPSPSHSLLSVESALSLRARRALVLRSMRRGFWWVWLWTCGAGGSFVRSSSSSAITAVTAVPLLLWHPLLPET